MYSFNAPALEQARRAVFRRGIPAFCIPVFCIQIKNKYTGHL
jgi:hypothetical protein